MEEETIIIKCDESGKRLDTYITDKLSGRFSRSQIKRLIDEGRLLVDGDKKKAHYRLAAKNVIEITLPAAKEEKIAPEDIPLNIIYEDDDIIVLNKEQGVVVHPAAGNPNHTLVNALLFHTKGKLSHVDSSTRPGIVHRLDKEVSGLMVVAKNDRAHYALVECFKKKTIKRRYIAFVHGHMAQDEGVASLPIGRSERDRKKMAVRFLHSKEASTKYKVLKRFPEYTKLELELETGRTHQIRVHMSYMDHPIIGDAKYGGGDFKRIALYAAELTLKHPCTNELLHFAVDMPAELKELDGPC